MTEKDKETVYANRFIGAGGVAYSEQSMAEDSIKRAQQKLLQEANIPTQNSLRDYPSKNAKDEIEHSFLFIAPLMTNKRNDTWSFSKSIVSRNQ